MNIPTERQFIPLNIAVLVVSDTRTEVNDTSGKLLVDRITETGHLVIEKLIVPDNMYQIRTYVSNWIASDAVNVIISTGGDGCYWQGWYTRSGNPSAG